MRKKVSRQKQKPTDHRLSGVLGIFLLGASIFICMALISYDSLDIALNTTQPNDPPMNYIGLVGAWFSFVAYILLGLGSFIFPIFLASLGLSSLLKGKSERIGRWFFWVCFTSVAVSCLLELQFEDELSFWVNKWGLNRLGPGGLLGEWILRRALVTLIGIEGSYLVLYGIVIAAVFFFIDIPWLKMAHAMFRTFLSTLKKIMGFVQEVPEVLSRKLHQWLEMRRHSPMTGDTSSLSHRDIESRLGYDISLEAKIKKKVIDANRLDTVQQEKLVEKYANHTAKNEVQSETKQESPSQPKEVKEKRIQLELIKAGDYQLPPLQLLDDISLFGNKTSSPEDLLRNAEILKTTLKEFGVDVEVSDITRGPVITRYELQPAPGVKVQRITGLSNDIALAMKAGSVRIIAPIPGKAAVGIEVPNITSALVSLKELLTSEEFKNAHMKIPLVIGKDVSGIPIVVDLTEMPHLLIAGTTGSGKSVCINSIVLNILFYASPEYIRFLMVDPKMVELSVFNDIPHLVIPVVTDARKAAGGLSWLVTEMERRYKLLAEAGVRNIELFNEKVRREEVLSKNSGEPLKALPYIVVVIDELADIMIVSSYEVENSIARLAQLSRAIGIHLIIATQRPSVDVITGVIKANFPARISFQVSSKVDSRTVLDTIGAEKLLGKGDLLYMPPGSSKLVRAQGPFVKESEIKRVMDFVRSQKVEITGEIDSEEILEKVKNIPVDMNQMDDEALVEESIKVIRNTSQASVSILQRKLRIGYSRAARIMDLLEERGVVGPYKGSKARDILIDLEAKGESI